MAISAAPRLLLVGCGKMGGALLQGVMAARAATRIAVIDPAPPPPHVTQAPEFIWVAHPAELDPFLKPDAVILAVKPQQLGALLPDYARFGDSLFLSVAAGVTLEKLSALLGNPKAAIIRAMPNLPASIGQGITVAVANRHATPDHCALADILLSAVGEVCWVGDEGLMDAVTALSGSGPAYVFALCEAMAEAGAALGLPDEQAQLLARHTIAGSGAMLAQGAQEAATLRRAVTSPGGTTEAALKLLLAADGLPALMKRAMQAAAARVAELAQ